MRKLKDNEVRIVFYDNTSIVFTLNRYEMEAVKTKKESELEDYIVKICNIKYDKGDYTLDSSDLFYLFITNELPRIPRFTLLEYIYPCGDIYSLIYLSHKV